MRTWMLPMVTAAACGVAGKDTSYPGTGDTDTVTGTGTGTTAGTGTGASTGTGTGTTAPLAALYRIGTSTVDGAYTGAEALVLVADEGYGAELCRITYDLVSSGPRDDCPTCDWAYDLVASNATLVLDEGQCLGVVGFDAANVGDLDGQVRSYGFNSSYVGHAEVLMFFDGDAWTSGTYASFEPDTGAFSYEWLDGYHAY